MAKNIVMNVLTSLGYEAMYPFNPANLLLATTEVTSTTSNYDLTISELTTPYENNMGIVLFIPNVTNIANATITLNVNTVCNIKFEDGTNITDGILVLNTPVLLKYYEGDFYLLMSKAQVGLINVDNTSDLNKPISTATQSALNGKLNNSASIPTNSNINDYITNGMYFYASTSTGLSNIPLEAISKMFALFVENNGNGVTQTLTIGQTGVQLFKRNSFGGSWGAWIQIPTITYGTEEPVAGTAVDGNIYIKYSLT